MNENFDQLEEDLKQKQKIKKDHKISGRSVFKLKEIIQAKAVSSEVERKKKSKKAKSAEGGSPDPPKAGLGRGSGDDQKTLAKNN